MLNLNDACGQDMAPAVPPMDRDLGTHLTLTGLVPSRK